MKSKISIYKNVLENPDKVIQDIELSVNDGEVSWYVAGVDSGSGAGQNTNIRDTHSIGIPYYMNDSYPIDAFKKIRDLLDNSFSKYIEEYIKENNMNISTYQNYEILKYGYGQKFDEHVDDSPSYPRTLSLVYYPNNEYDGGEIEFTKLGIKIKPEKNTLILFPSGTEYAHRVYPVVNGIRYSIVQWMN